MVFYIPFKTVIVFTVLTPNVKMFGVGSFPELISFERRGKSYGLSHFTE